MKIDKAGQTKLIIIGVAGILIIVFMNKILELVGIRKSATKLEKDESTAHLSAMKEFDPLYHKTVAHKPLGESMAQHYAKELNKAWRFFRPTFGTDEDLIYSTFGKLQNKVQISEVADQYYLMKKEDLRSRILKELNDKQQVKLNNIIKTLPNV